MISILRTFLIVCTLLWTTVSVAPMRKTGTHSDFTAPNINPLPPSKDPFYTAPFAYDGVPPGTILRVRSAPGLVKAIANCSAAYNILYRTTDSNYKPSWAVTTLLFPLVEPGHPTSNWTAVSPGSVLLSYQVSCKYCVLVMPSLKLTRCR